MWLCGYRLCGRFGGRCSVAGRIGRSRGLTEGVAARVSASDLVMFFCVPILQVGAQWFWATARRQDSKMYIIYSLFGTEKRNSIDWEWVSRTCLTLCGKVTRSCITWRWAKSSWWSFKASGTGVYFIHMIVHLLVKMLPPLLVAPVRLVDVFLSSFPQWDRQWASTKQ